VGTVGRGDQALPRRPLDHRHRRQLAAGRGMAHPAATGRCAQPAAGGHGATTPGRAACRAVAIDWRRHHR
jgi:hypothetical protein